MRIKFLGRTLGRRPSLSFEQPVSQIAAVQTANAGSSQRNVRKCSLFLLKPTYPRVDPTAVDSVPSKGVPPTLSITGRPGACQRRCLEPSDNGTTGITGQCPRFERCTQRYLFSRSRVFRSLPLCFKGFWPLWRGHPTGDWRKWALRVHFDGKLRLEFYGAKITSDVPMYIGTCVSRAG